jgi:hypothetical protein
MDQPESWDQALRRARRLHWVIGQGSPKREPAKGTPCPLYRKVSSIIRARAACLRGSPRFAESAEQNGEQRYLICGFKGWTFKEMIHQHHQFAHDGGEGDFGGLARRPEALINALNGWWLRAATKAAM